MNKSHNFQPKSRLAAGIALALFAGACLTGPALFAAEKAEPVPAPEHATNLPGTDLPRTDNPGKGYTKMSREEQITFARQDLATRLQISLESVNLSGVTQVKWRTNAIGCPQPGKTYTQMLVPGELFVFRVDNSAYRFHSLPGGQPFYCPKDQAEFPYVNSGDT